MDTATSPRTLYPELAPYRVHELRVSGGHVLHVEERGDPDGIAALVLHGGPGSGSSPLLSRFFDPARYRVIAVDQRGAGRSTPRGSVEHNTTADLIDDLQAVRELLGVESWLVVGGSWGATLALVYAAAHPTAVAGLLLRALFLGRREDIDGFFQQASTAHAAAWARFAAVAPADQRHDLIPWLARALVHGGPGADQAALAWWRWESALAGGTLAAPDPSGAAPAAWVDRYRVQSHYLVHHCWLEAPPLLDRLAGLPRVPTLLLHSRDDRICPPEGAALAHQRIPHSGLQWVEGAGHDPAHPAMAAAMVEALDTYASHGHFGQHRP
ncbi:MAG TPA: alpha/beta fold hydrolase [Rhizobacter sp.]|nr:alpha/beta fold hydrolase [Rhizobacter sp.]